MSHPVARVNDTPRRKGSKLQHRHELDTVQMKAVDHPGPTLRLLGPSASGKTTALIERAVRLVEGGADPEGVLFFVRDRRQAITLRDLLVRRLGRSVAGPSVLTFHAFAWSLLGRVFGGEDSSGPTADVGYQLAGYESEPILLTAFDQRAFVRDLLDEEDPSAWPVNGGLLGSNAFAGEVRDFLLRAQERMETPATVARLAEERGRPDWLEVARFYERYIQRLEDTSRFEDGRPRLDFARVLIEARRLVGEHPAVRDDLHLMYPHVLVDDFEESNRAEAALLQALLPAGGDGRTMVVAGDPDGAVYGFRGADPACLAAIGDESFSLERTHRRAEAPEVRLYSHVTEEAMGIVGRLREANSGGVPWGDIAVIVRDFHTLLPPLRRELKRSGVPHKVDGEAVQLNEDPVVRPVLDLFAVACRLSGHEELWAPLLISEIGGLTTNELVQVRRAARLAGKPLHDVCSEAASDGLTPDVARRVGELCHLVEEACGWAATLQPHEAFWKLWQRSEWFGRLVEEEDDRRLDSLTTLADALQRFAERRGSEARLVDFMETLASAEFAPGSVRLDGPEDSVTITTAHAAKGKEWALAIVAGCVEGMWPDPSRRGVLLDSDMLSAPKDYAARRADALSEEQRLFDLATSRSPDLVLTGLRAGGSDRSSAEPSRFIEQRVGSLPDVNAVVEELVLTPREAETAWRGVAASTEAPPAERVAALWALSQLPDVDPDRWWWGRRWTENPIPVTGDTKKTSYSRFSAYENCPLQYLYGQVLGLDPETSYHMAFGSLVHSLLEDAEAGTLPKDLDSMMAAAKHRWRPEAYPVGAVANYLWRDLGDIIKRYLRLEADNKHQTLATEKWFEFDVAGWLVRGKIDRIDRVGRDGLRLIDYKTGWFRQDSQVADDLQLATYILACLRDDELKAMGEPKCAELVFVRFEQKGAIRRATQLPKKDEDGRTWDVITEERVTALLRGVEAEEFGPSPDAECRFCKFKPICPLWSEGRELQIR